MLGDAMSPHDYDPGCDFGTVCAAGLCAFVLRIIPAVEKVSGEMKTSQSST